ncbi:MAG TPA: LPS assembly lipoprotein LptE [Aromatoleum sp.]|uniref:LPS-assembly lipoprotein LptE n=1 Tax=Aromatoleum sp. TaxID=2307007 RepID=UPI002B4686FA|nr:LPS assembly lipoprotein LptE [Aromatoleum sp.]HJV26344.1 LPS assembly lipoprotein LptE [Aromatoleum sp.]
MSHSRSRRRTLAALAALATTGALAGCGFQLRGPRPLAFSSIYLGVSTQSDLGAALRRRIRASGSTTVEDDPAKADVRLEILRNERHRDILTLTGAGKVREYELTYSIAFRLVDRAGAERIVPTVITAKREYNFDDSQVLAKEQEEALLYNDMQGDLVEQLVRRLAAVKS